MKFSHICFLFFLITFSITIKEIDEKAVFLEQIPLNYPPVNSLTTPNLAGCPALSSNNIFVGRRRPPTQPKENDQLIHTIHPPLLPIFFLSHDLLLLPPFEPRFPGFFQLFFQTDPLWVGEPASVRGWAGRARERTHPA